MGPEDREFEADDEHAECRYEIGRLNEKIANRDATIEEMAHRFACVLDHVTRGRMSKTNYTKEAMISESDDAATQHVEAEVDERTKELREELAAATAVTNITSNAFASAREDLKVAQLQLSEARGIALRSETLDEARRLSEKWGMGMPDEYKCASCGREFSEDQLGLLDSEGPDAICARCASGPAELTNKQRRSE